MEGRVSYCITALNNNNNNNNPNGWRRFELKRSTISHNSLFASQHSQLLSHIIKFCLGNQLVEDGGIRHEKQEDLLLVLHRK